MTAKAKGSKKPFLEERTESMYLRVRTSCTGISEQLNVNFCRKIPMVFFLFNLECRESSLMEQTRLLYLRFPGCLVFSCKPLISINWCCLETHVDSLSPSPFE